MRKYRLSVCELTKKKTWCCTEKPRKAIGDTFLSGERGSPKCTHGETHTCTLVQNCTAGCETRVRSRKVCVLASMATHSHEMQRTTQFSHAIQRGFFFFFQCRQESAPHTFNTLGKASTLLFVFICTPCTQQSHAQTHLEYCKTKSQLLVS